jgi:hypothetical protein
MLRSFVMTLVSFVIGVLLTSHATILKGVVTINDQTFLASGFVLLILIMVQGKE